MATFPERLRDEQPHVVVVIDDQEGPVRAAPGLDRASGRRIALCTLVRDPRKQDGYDRSRARPGLDSRNPAGLGGDAVDHGEAETRALAPLLGREEGIERALDDFR